MSNDAVYAAGLVNRALDPATQPPEIKEFLRAEYDALCQLVSGMLRVIDIGCGTGRHLLGLQDSLGLGLGLDYERGYVAEARRRAPSNVHFVTADATAIPIRSTFNIAICAFNTWGTMSDKAGVLREMRRVAPKPGTRFLSVYSPASVPPRREWYRRLGHAVVAETSEYLEVREAFDPSTSLQSGYGGWWGSAQLSPHADCLCRHVLTRCLTSACSWRTLQF